MGLKMEKLECKSDLPDKKLRSEWMKLLLDVVKKLPSTVQRTLQQDVTVYFSYKTTGTYMESRKKLIYLNCYQMEMVNMPIWAKRYVVAHVFAHAYSGSGDEKVARSLMEEWGFRDHERYCKWLTIRRDQHKRKNI